MVVDDSHEELTYSLENIPCGDDHEESSVHAAPYIPCASVGEEDSHDFLALDIPSGLDEPCDAAEASRQPGTVLVAVDVVATQVCCLKLSSLISTAHERLA